MFKYFLTSILLVASFTIAQDFVFVSSRIQIDADLSQAEEWQTNQNEFFLYKDGFEVRLTSTNNLDEYDPSISPDGKLIAYVASSWVYPNELENSNWQLFVTDLRGRQIANFSLANSQSEMRPAGGYTISWLANSSGMFTNVINPDSYDWDVYYFDIATKDSKKVAEGFMPLLSPDNKLLATYLDGTVRIYNLDLDESWTISEGIALAWYDNNSVAIDDDLSLKLVNVYDSQVIKELYSAQGVYEYFSINDTGEYIFALRQPSSSVVGSSLHRFKNNEAILELQLDDVITGLSFLADGSLVYSLQNDYSDQIYKINSHGKITPLVASFGANYRPQGFTK